MQDVISFEAELAKIMVPDEERRDEEKIYHRMSIAELQNKAPFVSSRHLIPTEKFLRQS